jgi:hypothetical protein
VSRWETWPERWSELQRWRHELTGELRLLPETLRQLREGVASFQVVCRRLEASTDGLDRVKDLYASGIGDTVRQLGEATSALQRQLAGTRTGRPPGADLLESAVADFNRTVGALIELNPFLRSPRKGSEAPG